MTEKSELGRRGEELACDYLKNKGYKIVERNFLKLWGELDIVAKAPDGTLVFLEVKTVSGSPPIFKAEDQMTKDKIRKFKRVAALYAGANEKLFNDKKGWRLDLIAITFNGDEYDILQYENVV